MTYQAGKKIPLPHASDRCDVDGVLWRVTLCLCVCTSALYQAELWLTVFLQKEGLFLAVPLGIFL